MYVYEHQKAYIYIDELKFHEKDKCDDCVK